MMNILWRTRLGVLPLFFSMLLLLAATSAHAATLTANYTYDNIGRLTSTSYTNAANSGSINYNYDPAGNILASTVAGSLGTTNQPPAPTARAITTASGTAGTSQIAANDPNTGDTHTYVISTAPANGTAIVSSTGLATYTPNAAYVGADSFVVTVTDNGIPQKSGMVTIQVAIASAFGGTVTPQIAAGEVHTVALKSDGTVVAWGDNTKGQTNVPAGLIGVTAIAAGSYHTVALKSDGTVVAWGDNTKGQTNVPAGLTGVTAIAAGFNHTIALKLDGTVVAWGSNWYNQMMIPTVLTGVTAIAAGGWHSIALKLDGTVVAWGFNRDGQATPPIGLTGVTAIAAGGWHSVALKSNGTVVAWGNNRFGQATPPIGLTRVTAIAAGGYQTVALKSDGTVVAWGQTAIPIGTIGVTAIAAGGFHIVALKSDGTVVAWGANWYGQTMVPTGLNLIVAPVVNQSPAPTAPAITTASTTAATSQVTANDPNAGDTFTYAVSTAPTTGTATVNATGLATYTPNAGFSGIDAFVVAVTDNGGLSATVRVNVTVAAYVDTVLPVVTPLASITVAATSINGAAITDTLVAAFLNGVTATDNVGVVGAIANDAPATLPVGTTTVTFTAVDAAGNTGTATSRVTVSAYIPPDTIKPVITLIGNTTIQIAQGTVYSDAGATALDNVDGTLTNKIMVTNNVNTSVVATYTVSYNVKDTAGNAATQVVRSVKVVAPGAAMVTVARVNAAPAGTVSVPLTIAPSAGVAVASFNLTINYDGNTLTLGAVRHNGMPASWTCSNTTIPPSPSGIKGIQLLCSTAVVGDAITSSTTVALMPMVVNVATPAGTALAVTLATNSKLFNDARVVVPSTLTSGSIIVSSAAVSYSLTPGWNLVAFPLDFGATGLTDFLAKAPGVSAIWIYKNGQWQSYIVGIPSFMNSLSAIKPGDGYWVKSGSNALVSMTGITAPPLTTPVYQSGWHLVGTLAPKSNIPAYLISQGATEIWGYSNGNWCSSISGVPAFMNCLKTMQREAGYFIKTP